MIKGEFLQLAQEYGMKQDQGVAYGMCAELFADPAKNCGVGVMTSGVRLIKQPPLMRAGFDLLALGFAAIGKIG